MSLRFALPFANNSSCFWPWPILARASINSSYFPSRFKSRLAKLPFALRLFSFRLALPNKEILSVSSNPFSRTVVINKGTNEDIFVGQVALAGENIYGQVESVTPNSAMIIQLTDARHNIHVRNTRTGLGALASGTGKFNQLELKHVEASMDIQTGDIFVSSGLGQLFPPDFPVAKVSSVAYNPGDSFMKVKARSLADFTKTREILLIWRADYSIKTSEEAIAEVEARKQAAEEKQGTKQESSKKPKGDRQ